MCSQAAQHTATTVPHLDQIDPDQLPDLQFPYLLRIKRRLVLHRGTAARLACQ